MKGRVTQAREGRLWPTPLQGERELQSGGVRLPCRKPVSPNFLGVGGRGCRAGGGGENGRTPICPCPSAVSSNPLLPSLVQPRQICCCTQHWCRRPRTSRTGPCTCCTVLLKRTAWLARPAQPTGLTATGVCSDSPPRSTTWDALTSGPRLGATPGCGMSVMGERVK